jgi:hypothetical protein
MQTIAAIRFFKTAPDVAAKDADGYRSHQNHGSTKPTKKPTVACAK